MISDKELVERILDMGGAIECACSEKEIQHIKDEALKFYLKSKAENLPISDGRSC